jgi:hypothetical protein
LAADDLARIDLKDLAEWKRRNQRDRLKLLDQYVAWLERKGVLTAAKPPKKPPSRKAR